MTNLTPEGKHKLSRDIKFHRIFEQALIERLFDDAAPDLTKRPDLTTDNGTGNQVLSIKGRKRVSKAQQFIRGNTGNLEKLISGLLSQFGNNVKIDINNVNDAINIIKQGVGDVRGQDWLNALSGVMPGDENTVA